MVDIIFHHLLSCTYSPSFLSDFLIFYDLFFIRSLMSLLLSPNVDPSSFLKVKGVDYRTSQFSTAWRTCKVDSLRQEGLDYWTSQVTFLYLHSTEVK